MSDIVIPVGDDLQIADPSSALCEAWASVDDLACSDLDSALLEAALEAAQYHLYVLSGRQFRGVCTKTVRPCRQPCRCGRRCGLSQHRTVDLGNRPLRSIEQVKIDGEIVDPAHYKIVDATYLFYVGQHDSGRTGWPCCQRMDLEDDQDGTFSVTFTYGKQPPVTGRRAVAQLACELARDASGDAACKLPKRVTSITRQGVSMIALDPFDFLENGRTGLYEVDLFLKGVNPKGQRLPSVVMSPDTSPRARTIT